MQIVGMRIGECFEVNFNRLSVIEAFKVKFIRGFAFCSGKALSAMGV